MPTLTRWFLRAAMVSLVAAFAIGLITSLPSLADVALAWRPVYIHLIVLGWASEMIFGVAYWMFPRKDPLDLARVPWAGWICFSAINAGLVVRVFSEPALAMHPTPLAQTGALVAALLQLVAVVAFVVLAWPRVIGR